MTIPVSPKSQDLYKAYITCLNPVLKLRPKEIEVLDVLTRTYFSLLGASKQGQILEKDIYERMNGGAGRKIMRDNIKMSEASFNNHVMKLKQKKILTDTNVLPTWITTVNINKQPLKIEYTIETPKA